MGSVAAEILVLRKRVSTWILMGIWVLLGMMFAYLLPYLSYRGDSGGVVQTPLEAMLPENLAEQLLGGFPFFGGVIALMVGVLTIGSDYGWDTLKSVLTQRAGRMHLLGAKLVALEVGLLGFVVAIFIGGALTSVVVAASEDAAISWPSIPDVAQAVGAGWLILSVWAAFGFALAVLSRGTALAIGLGILYTFVVEGILSALAGQVSWLDALVEYFLRANAYSLVVALGVPTTTLGDNGPGSFFGPFVGEGQAIVVLAAYMVAFLVLSGALFRRRDLL